MTSPSSDATLIAEIRTLSSEVSRLRDETEHLEQTTVPREEQRRLRRRNTWLGLLAALVVATVLGAFAWVLGQLHDSQDQLAKTNYQSCVSRNKSAALQGRSVTKINHLLGTLRSTDEVLLGGLASRSPVVRKAKDDRIAAYDDYLNFVIEVTSAPPGPKPPPCESYLR